MSRKLTVVLAGGGTGGHVYPALAMGDALAARGHSLHYFGDAGRLEGRVVPDRGIPFTAVPALQYPRSGLVAKIRFAWGLFWSIWRTRKLLKAVNADVVLGVGGYISAPPVLAAWTLGVPRVVHEANVVPGLANRLCARVADLVLLTYSQTSRRLPGRAPRETVGCPVHPGVTQGDRAAAFARYELDPDRSTMVIVGGSLGAATINRIGVAVAQDPQREFQLILISGPKYLDEVSGQLSPLPQGVALVGYENKMPEAYAAADLVVCRAGSSTLAELTAVGKASVLIPSPNVTENHQEANARGLETVGAAIVITEADLNVDSVVTQLRALMGDAVTLDTMNQAARAQTKPDTGGRVADLIEARFG